MSEDPLKHLAKEVQIQLPIMLTTLLLQEHQHLQHLEAVLTLEITAHHQPQIQLHQELHLPEVATREAPLVEVALQIPIQEVHPQEVHLQEARLREGEDNLN